MNLRDANLQVHEKNSVTYPFSCNIFCLHFLRTYHNYFFQRGFESASKISFRKYKQKIQQCYLCFTCFITIHLSLLFIVACGIWLCLEYGFCQVNSNLLQFKDYKHILFFSACVLICSTSVKVNCSPSWW